MTRPLTPETLVYGLALAGDPLSDYDFGVLVDEVKDVYALRARLASELANALGARRVDVVILNRAPVELAYAVIAQGRLLYERNEAV